MLFVDGVTKAFGGILAVRDVSFRLEKGEILGLIGPNGSGKSTLFNVISGFYRPTRGAVFFKGERIDGLKPHMVARRGLVMSFQKLEQFPHFTALQNMMMGPLNYLPMKAARRKAEETLQLLGLSAIADETVTSLSYGHQRSVNLGVCLGTNAELLLLDEPVAGLNPERVASALDLIRTIRDSGITVLIVEHNMKAIFSLCDRIIVLSAGEKIAEGTPKEVRENADVIGAYLGAGDA